MRLAAASCLVVLAALFNGADTARAKSDLSGLEGTFWRIDHLDRASGAVRERALITLLVGRELFKSIVVHISRETIDFNAPGGGCLQA
jgi:hypothetical protein